MRDELLQVRFLGNKHILNFSTILAVDVYTQYAPGPVCVCVCVCACHVRIYRHPVYTHAHARTRSHF